MPAFQKSLETSEQNRVSGNLPVVDNLSDREMHVFLLIGSGKGTKKIAHSLRLRAETIETHRESIKRKLGLNSGRQLVGRAITYVEENFLPQKREVAIESKKKVVRFPAA
jgi:DNA-binding NarL/FixJ family response regulator